MAGPRPRRPESAITPAESAIVVASGSEIGRSPLAHWGGSHEWMTYSGVGVLWLAYVGWLGRPRQRGRGRRLPVACSSSSPLELTAPLYSLLIVLPGAELLRVPPRVWYLIALLFAVLAGPGRGRPVPSADPAASAPKSVARRSGPDCFPRIVRAGNLRSCTWIGHNWECCSGIGVGIRWLLTACYRSALRGRLPRTLLGRQPDLLVGIDLVLMDSSRRALPVWDGIRRGRGGVVVWWKWWNGSLRRAFDRHPTSLARWPTRIVNGVDPLQLLSMHSFLMLQQG